MKKFINATRIEGWLYEHALEKKVTGEGSKNPGQTYIAGTISIATDNMMTNIVPIHYTYVVPTYSKSGKENPNFKILEQIIDGKIKSVMADGKDAAAKFRVDSSIDLNEFYSDRNGTEELVSVKRNEGGFIHTAQALNENENERNTFDVDMVITNARRIEADEERNLPEKMIIKGAIFNGFNNRYRLLPVEFTVTNANAMNYFEGLEATAKEPVFTRIKGRQINESIVRKITEESAFGEPSVREVTSSHKDFVVTWAAKETYEWDSEETLTAKELSEMMSQREITLADIRKRRDDYLASKNGPTAPAQGGFNF